MKKFGTPNGAAPGNAKENVGFEDDGAPPDERSFDEFELEWLVEVCVE